MVYATRTKPREEKVQAGSLEWMTEIHQRLLDGEYPRALTMLEVAMNKLRNADTEKAEKVAKEKSCPDCLGSGFKPTGPGRNAPHVKCFHDGQQPILKAETPAADCPF